MARPLRLELAGGVYHVTSRGDRREDIFLTDDDRRIWLKLLGEVCERFNWVCHGWCQMTNHYHVVLETVEPNLWDKLIGQLYLGDDAFLEKMSALANDTIQEVPLIQRRPVARDLHAYTQNPGDRNAAMAQAFATGAFTLRAIADAFGVHYATVSRAVRKEKK